MPAGVDAVQLSAAGVPVEADENPGRNVAGMQKRRSGEAVPYPLTRSAQPRLSSRAESNIRRAWRVFGCNTAPVASGDTCPRCGRPAFVQFFVDQEPVLGRYEHLDCPECDDTTDEPLEVSVVDRTEPDQW